ncbi:MAG: hypothetical protein CM15mP115_19540 [Alphaproteobacteria bacterium]|nr:MAG: hypothetical protein CM15mP115_19540 [Alphaproteobacteria bacterium]
MPPLFGSGCGSGPLIGRVFPAARRSSSTRARTPIPPPEPRAAFISAGPPGAMVAPGISASLSMTSSGAPLAPNGPFPKS